MRSVESDDIIDLMNGIKDGMKADLQSMVDLIKDTDVHLDELERRNETLEKIIEACKICATCDSWKCVGEWTCGETGRPKVYNDSCGKWDKEVGNG
jgi:hypothetical protein